MTDRQNEGVFGGWDPPRPALRELVMAATVRIHRTGVGYVPEGSGAFLGSGFFIAPNWVLTCAHVVDGAEGGEVTVVFRPGPFSESCAVPGEVAAFVPERVHHSSQGDRPAPDLALVRLREPVDHDCLYVSERPTPHYTEGRVYYAGWAFAEGQPQPSDGFLTVHGTIGGWSSDVQMRLGGSELPLGMSGGPVIDPVRGEVVGVLQSRADHAPGGTSIGIERLRTLPVPWEAGPEDLHRHDPYQSDLYQAVWHAHDRYHRDRQRPTDSTRPTWTDLQAELGARPGRTLSPYERVELLGRLADLPPPESTRGLLDILHSLPDFRPPALSPAPRGWRDGLGALYGNARHDGVLPLVVDYAMRVMTAERPLTPFVLDAEQALWEWIKQAATHLGADRRAALARSRAQHLGDRLHERGGPSRAGHRGGDAAREPFARSAVQRSVLLQVEPRAWERGQCDWSVAVVERDGEATGLDDGQGAALADLAACLAEPLAEAFRRCDEPGRSAPLYAALPYQMLDLPVDEWRLWSGARPLGVERPVLVRCSNRDQLSGEDDWYGAELPGDDLESDRLDRWRRVHDGYEGYGARAEVLDCDDALRRPVPALSVLRGLAPGTIPVLCREGDRRYEDDETALGRIIQAGYGVVLWRRWKRPSDSVCGEFHRGARMTVDGAAGAGELPGLVHGLRDRLRKGLTEAFWAHGIALLYDDPHQPLPGADDLLEAP
ncbi:trypsin-like peptidase domain-containing protein [Streptomyces sp. NPDC007157]|uniref:VMAP-C domain-containing protein n=1 Tax=Streptomyces sp. NPDC007157 TaxID=3154681 RepID=UPI0033F2D96B